MDVDQIGTGTATRDDDCYWRRYWRRILMQFEFVENKFRTRRSTALRARWRRKHAQAAGDARQGASTAVSTKTARSNTRPNTPTATARPRSRRSQAGLNGNCWPFRRTATRSVVSSLKAYCGRILGKPANPGQTIDVAALAAGGNRLHSGEQVGHQHQQRHSRRSRQRRNGERGVRVLLNEPGYADGFSRAVPRGAVVPQAAPPRALRRHCCELRR